MSVMDAVEGHWRALGTVLIGAAVSAILLSVGISIGYSLAVG